MRRPTTAAIPNADAAMSRRGEDDGVGAGRASTAARTQARVAVSVNTTASQSGRVIHQPMLLGSGSAKPVTIANTAQAPAIASSTGMCHR